MASAQVLVIEDAPEYAQLIGATLRKGGHEVTRDDVCVMRVTETG